jgi:hypothetical protein
MSANNSTQSRTVTGFQKVPADYREWIEIGDLRIARLNAQKLWMQHRAGEGMEVDQKKLTKLLEKFFWREF